MPLWILYEFLPTACTIIYIIYIMYIMYIYIIYVMCYIYTSGLTVWGMQLHGHALTHA